MEIKFRFSRNLKKVHDFISSEVIGQKKDKIALISGSVGSGKSTLGMQKGIMDCVSLDVPFDLHKHVIYFPKYSEIRNAVFNLPDHHPIVVDEAIRTAYKMDQLTKDSKRMKILLDVCRKKNKRIYFLLPKVRDFSSLMIDRVSTWFHVTYRDKHKGVVSLFMADNNPFSRNKWDFDLMEKKFKDLVKEEGRPTLNTYKKAHRFFNGFENYVLSFDFYAVPKKFYDQYEQISNSFVEEESELELLNENKSEVTDARDLAFTKLLGSQFYESKKTITALSEEYGLGHPIISEYVKKYRELKGITKEEHLEKIKTKIGRKKKPKPEKKKTIKEIEKTMASDDEVFEKWDKN